MVTSVVDVSIHIDMSMYAPDYNLLPDIGDIGSPVRNTIVEILGIERPVIRDVVRAAVTDADASIVSASVEAENSH
jgi:enhancing lycopene biosynthesis protein 2